MPWLSQDACNSSKQQRIPVAWHLIFCLWIVNETHLLLKNLLFIPPTTAMCCWISWNGDITWWVKGTQHQTIQEMLGLFQNEAPNYKLMCSIPVLFCYWSPISVANIVFFSVICLWDFKYALRMINTPVEHGPRFYSWIWGTICIKRVWQKLLLSVF